MWTSMCCSRSSRMRLPRQWWQPPAARPMAKRLQGAGRRHPLAARQWQEGGVEGSLPRGETLQQLVCAHGGAHTVQTRPDGEQREQRGARVVGRGPGRLCLVPIPRGFVCRVQGRTMYGVASGAVAAQVLCTRQHALTMPEQQSRNALAGEQRARERNARRAANIVLWSRIPSCRGSRRSRKKGSCERRN